MVQSQFSLAWESYKSNICTGFSSLQQNGEFVDMTLAADGHFVKVHQVMMALVSPYLKELITSAPCQHPVIFLNNVTYRTLCCLLEYVYTGEVLVPSENLLSFVETAKSLHIRGLENLNDMQTDTSYKMVENMPQFDENIQCHITGIKRLAVPSDSGMGTKIDLPAAAQKVVLRCPSTAIKDTPKEIVKNAIDTSTHFPDTLDTHDMDDSDNDNELLDDPPANQPTNDPNAAASNLQFSVSIRGSLQVILNRYIYNLNSNATRGGMRRWRCVDYRNNRCKAFIITKGNVVLNRANLHNHAFHDKKILQKIEKKAVFTAFDEVQIYKEKEDTNRKQIDSGMEEFKFTEDTFSAS